ncbi:MAG: tetratricopeptide repeat protein [Salibacteraceae bacterium]|nr:tetratricopeptide repeat protein [Salibacteraceae bacterium]MDP4763156.1 tetratricopeptide repeat protein [Salibacteraceae bacterium]
MNKLIEQLNANHWLKLALVFIVCFALYGKTLRYQLVLDDDLVISNSFVQEGVAGIPKIVTSGYLAGFNGESTTYRPMPLVMFAIEKSLFDGKPLQSRFIHILMYVLAGLFLWKMLLFWFPNQKMLAFIVTLLFLAHPIHTEVVANLKSRDELLAFLFFTLMFISFHRYVQVKQIRPLLFSLLWFLLAMLSKESAVMLLVLVPLSLWFIYRQSMLNMAKMTWPFLAVFVVYFGLRWLVLGDQNAPEERFIINNAFVHATGALDRITNSAHLLYLYFAKTIWPTQLSWDYSFSTIQAIAPSSAIGLFSLVFAGVLVVVLAVFTPKKSTLVFLLSAFILMLIPVLNLFILIGANFAERFLFLPSLFLVIAVVWLVFEATSKFQVAKNRTALSIIFVAVFLLFSGQTINRNTDWESNETLFAASLITNPESARVQTSVGTVYRQKAEQSRQQQTQAVNYEKSVKHYKQAIEILPETYDAWYNLGVIYQSTGATDLAQNAFEEVLQIDETHPDARNNLGVIFINQGSLDEAEQMLLKAIEYKPNHTGALGNLGVVYHNKKQFDLARNYYQKSLTINPNQPIMIKNLGLLKP